MGRALRYLKIKQYDGPDVTSAYVTTEYGNFDAKDIYITGKNLMIDFDLREATKLYKLHLDGDDGHFIMDVSHCKGGISDFSTIYNGPTYKRHKGSNGGCLGVLWKIIKWIIIITVVLAILRAIIED